MIKKISNISIAALLFMLPVKHGFSEANSVVIIIPPGIDLQSHEITLPQRHDIKTRQYIIELTIYSFSTGKEILTYDDNRTLRKTEGKGALKALVKIKKNGRLTQVQFISVTGSSRDELLKGLYKKFNRMVLEH